MNPSQMADSNFAAADAAGIVFGERTNHCITIFGILSVGATGKLVLMTATRLVYSLAQAKILPRSMSRVNRRGTPTAALLFSAIVAAAIILLGGYNELSSMGISLFQGVTGLAIMAVIGLRKCEPELERPFKTPWYPWPIILVALLRTLLLLAQAACQYLCRMRPGSYRAGNAQNLTFEVGPCPMAGFANKAAVRLNQLAP